MTERVVQSLGRVMLIDDEEIDRRLYARVLKRANVIEGLIGFSYAAEALDYFRDPASPPVDVILLDINMPAMNGFEFLERLTEFRADLAYPLAVVIMLTTSLNPTDQARARSFELVRAFLNKPLSVDGLEDVAHALLAARTAA